ncbi:MAG: DUF2809 domain-containing protein [Myxococcota bacterium]
MRLPHALLTFVFLLGGVGVLLYAGPGRVWVRGSLGDVLIVPFLVHGLGVLIPGYTRWRIAGVAIFALGAELLQLANLVAPDAPAWLHLTVGSTFDPWDLLGYTVGVGVAILTSWGLAAAGYGAQSGSMPAPASSKKVV